MPQNIHFCRRPLVVALLTLILGLTIPQPVEADAPPPLNAVVLYVIDGDTFKADVLLPDERTIRRRIRLENASAAEITKKALCPAELAAGRAATEALKALLPEGAVVDLWNAQEGRYQGRIIARVTLDGLDLGQALIDAGHAVPYAAWRKGLWCW